MRPPTSTLCSIVIEIQSDNDWLSVLELWVGTPGLTSGHYRLRLTIAKLSSFVFRGQNLCDCDSRQWAMMWQSVVVPSADDSVHPGIWVSVGTNVFALTDRHLGRRMSRNDLHLISFEIRARWVNPWVKFPLNIVSGDFATNNKYATKNLEVFLLKKLCNSWQTQCYKINTKLMILAWLQIRFKMLQKCFK